MPISPQEAKEWAFKNSKFLKLGDGDSFTAVLKDMKTVTSRFDAEKEVIRYTFEFPDGTLKYWENGSGSLLENMASLVGKNLMITRFGEKSQTRYEVAISLD